MIRSILAILFLSMSVNAYSMEEMEFDENSLSSLEDSVAYRLSIPQTLGFAGAALVGSYSAYKVNNYFESKCPTSDKKGSKKCVALREVMRFSRIFVPVSMVAAGHPVYRYELKGYQAKGAIEDGLMVGLVVYGLDAGWRLTKLAWNKVTSQQASNPSDSELEHYRAEPGDLARREDAIRKCIAIDKTAQLFKKLGEGISEPGESEWQK